MADREYKFGQNGNDNNSLDRNESLSEKYYCNECGSSTIDSNNINNKQNYVSSRIPHSKSSDTVNQIVDSSSSRKCQDCNNNSNKIKKKFSSSLFSSKSYCNISSLASNEKSDDENVKEETKQSSLLVMNNFRELLWYWREYYLRRGRDRLSIEFSTHIPFENWIDLVGKNDIIIIIVILLKK